MSIIEPHPAGAVVAVKVAAGSSRQKIVGPLGERLKVAVRAPPEKGAANKAICALVAGALGVRPADVAVLHGQRRPEKELLVRGLSAEETRGRLGLS